MSHFAEYSEGVAPNGPVILKDGHAMFPQDIVLDLNRKSSLEDYKVKIRACMSKLRKARDLYASMARKVEDQQTEEDLILFSTVENRRFAMDEAIKILTLDT